MNRSMTAVAGSGVMGLTLGRLLPGAVLYEKSPFVGGPSRTIRHKEFRFDTGLHLLWGLAPECERFLRPLIQDRYLKLPYSPERHLFLLNGRRWREMGRLSSVAAQASPAVALGLYLSYGFRKVFPMGGKTHRDLITNQYGDLYYRIFVRDVTKKITGLKGSEIELASPRGPQGRLLGRLIRRARRALRRGGAAPPSSSGEVLYPLPWFGRIVEKLAEGLDIRRSSEITRIHRDGKRVRSIEINRGRTFPCERLLWAGFPAGMVDLLDPPETVRKAAASIHYRNLVYAVLFFEADRVMDSHLADALGNEIFARLFEPKWWGEEMGPPGRTAVCFEIYCASDDPLWGRPDGEIIEAVYRDFRRYYSAPRPYEGLVFRIPRVRHVSDRRTREALDTLYGFLGSIENLHLPSQAAVQKGLHINSSIQEALRMAEEVRSALPQVTANNPLD